MLKMRRMTLRRDTYICCSGPDREAARGINSPVSQPLEEGIWRCYSGAKPTAASGIVSRAPAQPREGTCTCCNGQGLTDALGIVLLAAQQPNGASCTFCSGRERMDVPGIRMHALVFECCTVGAGQCPCPALKGAIFAHSILFTESPKTPNRSFCAKVCANVFTKSRGKLYPSVVRKKSICAEMAPYRGGVITCVLSDSWETICFSLLFSTDVLPECGVR